MAAVVYKYTKEIEATYLTFSAWISAIGSDERSIIIATDTEITGTVTVPSNIDIAGFYNGAKFTGTGSLTINKMSCDPQHQIFDSTLTAVTLACKDIRAEWFGAVGGGVTDSSNAFLKVLRIDGATIDLQGKTFVVAGNTHTGDNWVQTADNVTIKNGTLLHAVTAYPVSKMLTGDNCTLENVVFDFQDQNRGVTLGDNCVVRNCEFLDAAMGTASEGGTVLVPGSYCNIDGCKFTTYLYSTTPLSAASFAIRLYSDFSLGLPPDDCPPVHHTIIQKCKFVGAFGWNTIEIAGPNCRYITVRECMFDGGAQTAVECDKGASYCTIENNVITGLNQGLIVGGQTGTPIRTQGYPNAYSGGTLPYIARGNKVLNNRILNSNYTAYYFVFDWSDETTCQNNYVDSSYPSSIYSCNSSTTNLKFINNFIEDCTTLTLIGENHLIQNNTLKGFTYRGINIDSIVAGNIIIDGNYIEVNDPNFTLGVTANTAKPNVDIVVKNNKMVYAGAGNAYAFSLPQCNLIQVINNIINGYIYVYRNRDAVSKPMIVGNTLINCDTIITPDVLNQQFAGILRDNFTPNAVSSSISRPGASEHTFSNQPPTSGFWGRGAIVMNALPTANGVIGWECVTAGTPGTWCEIGRANTNILAFASALPTTGTYTRGDVLINLFPNTGVYFWACVTTGTYGGTDPVWSSFGKISSTGLGMYGTNPPATQPAHIADAAVASGANPTKVEYDALVGTVNAILARMEGFGMQATS